MDGAGKKRIFSGIQPSGDLTIGSYFGALKNWVALQDEYECVYCIVDMHAITARQVPAELRRRTLEQMSQYLACGLDPEKSILFVQSHVPQHAQLGWILNCFAQFGELSRMTQFKDKSTKRAGDITGGLFTYPVLMAADILLYQAALVPVGADQKQHVELCRDIAQRFNNAYSETFTLPEPFIPKTGARVMSLANPSAKMSKSDPEGCVFLMDSPDAIARKFKRAVTDCDSEIKFDAEGKKGVSNLLTIWAAAAGTSVDEAELHFAGKTYSALKTETADATVEMLRPIQQKAAELLGDKAELARLCSEGASKAAFIAEKTLRKVQRKIGFVEK